MPYQNKTTGEIISDQEYQSRFGIQSIQQPVQPEQPKSIFRRGAEFLGEATGITGVAKGVKEAGRIGFAGLRGKEIPSPSITPRRFLGSAATAGLTAATLGGAGIAGGLGVQALKTAGLGAGFAGAEALQKERIPTTGELTTGAALGGAIPFLGRGIQLTKKGLTDLLPKSLVKAYFPTTKDITQHILRDTKLGFTKTMLNNAKTNVKQLSNQVDDILEKSPDILISKNNLLRSVAQSYGQTGGGGTITSQEAERIIRKVAPEIKGFLSRETLTLKEANKVRKAIDLALGDRFFEAKHSPFTKEITGTFNSFLRDLVKTQAPKTKPIFDELSKEITLRNSLIKSTKKFGRVNLRDLIAIIAGATTGATTGDVGGTVGGAALGVLGGRALMSPAAGLGVAKGLQRLGQKQIPEIGRRFIKTGILRQSTD